MEHNGGNNIDKCMSHQTHGVTKWCWRNKVTNRLQYV